MSEPLYIHCGNQPAEAVVSIGLIRPATPEEAWRWLEELALEPIRKHKGLHPEQWKARLFIERKHETGYREIIKTPDDLEAK